MNEIYDFTAANGVSFRALITKQSGEFLIKFYDRRWDFTVNGQDTGAHYFVKTLMSGYERLAQSGLCLHGGVADWTLDARTFRTLANWMVEVCV